MRCPLSHSLSPPQSNTRGLAEWSPHGHLPSTASTIRGTISSSCRDASIRCRRSGLRTRLIRKIWGGKGEPQQWGMLSWGTQPAWLLQDEDRGSAIAMDRCNQRDGQGDTSGSTGHLLHQSLFL